MKLTFNCNVLKSPCKSTITIVYSNALLYVQLMSVLSFSLKIS